MRRWLALIIPALAVSMAAGAAVPTQTDQASVPTPTPTSTAEAAASVAMFSPLGLSPQVRQVAVRFATPMVPLGDPRVRVDVFTITCSGSGVPFPGSARWVSDRDWVYDFARDLPTGAACRFDLARELRDAAGDALAGRSTFTFHTGQPTVTQVGPWPGSRIDEDQRFALRFSGAVDAERIARHTRLVVAGIVEPVAVRALSGAERDAVLANLFEPPDVDANAAVQGAVDVVVEPVLRLPPDAQVELVVAAAPVQASTEPAASEGQAEPQRFAFTTRRPLSVRVSCQRVNAEAGCIPLTAIDVYFTAPVSVATMAGASLQPVGDDATQTARALAADADDRSDFQTSFRVRGPFPPGARYRLQLPAELRDDAGRPLGTVDAERLLIDIDAMPPLAKFAAGFGIVEAATPVLPVTVRGIEADALTQGASLQLTAEVAGVRTPSAQQILHWLRATERQTPGQSLLAQLPPGVTAQALSLPPVGDRTATEVIGIPLAGNGLHVVEIGSRVLGDALLASGNAYYATAMAMVTNLGVHLKTARDGSALVWVTTLDAGEPVAGAEVVVWDCAGNALAAAVTDDVGIARFDGLPAMADCEQYGYRGGRLVTARLQDDVSFVHTSWDKGIESWRFDVPTSWSSPGPIAHTVLDRSLLRAGETVHMKHFLRLPVRGGLAVPPLADTRTLSIAHEGGDDTFTFPLRFDVNGTATSEWSIPLTARLGRYRLQFTIGDAVVDAGSFRVEQFRLPMLQGKLQVPAEPVLAGTPFAVDVALQYLSGGPAAGLAVDVRTQTRPLALAPVDGFESYAFMLGDVTEGIRRSNEDDAPAEAASAPDRLAKATPLVLDATGGGRALVAPVPPSGLPREVLAEASFRDPNGEVQTLSRTLPVWPAARLIGMRLGQPVSADQPLHVDVALLDFERRGVRAKVSVDLLQRKVYSYRKRLVGGFYAYEHTTETKKVATLCEGRSDRGGTFSCVVPTLAVSGDLIVRARANDEAGRVAATHATLWLPGPDDYWYEATDSDRMDLVPERTNVEVGDTARIRVRMPFREARALVTVEREGVAEAYVQKLSGRDPAVRVPILDSHAPNVFVSVLAVRGRVATPAPTALVDLARPAARLGITELRVGLQPRTLSVRVEAEQDAYRVRERGRATIRVRTADGKRPPPGSEVAVAVVDAALLELAPNASWALLEAMHGRRSLDVQTFTAQQQIVGRRHFGLKARPAGGGGGSGLTRELFDTLLLWNPRVPLDADGEARIEFALNDALTTFRIAAIASADSRRFGSGFASVRTTQELMLLPGVAPVARLGDRYSATFTVRNTTDAEMPVRVALNVDGLRQPLEPQEFKLAAGEARIATWALAVPAGIDELTFDAAATGPGGISDQVRVRQQVSVAVPERVLQAELLQVDGAVSRMLERPADALPGVGGIDISLRPTLAGNRDGIERFFRDYPYGCLEQTASKAIGLGDAARWQALMATLPTYLDADGLARFWPNERALGSDVLTAYLLAVAHATQWSIPEPTLARMLAGLQGFVDGRVQRDTYAGAVDLPLRRLAAFEALSRYGAVDASRLASLPTDIAHLPTSGLLDYLSVLRRLPGVANGVARVREVEGLLRARLTLGGTTLGFSTEAADSMDWMLATAETNLLRFLWLAADSEGFAPDMPRLLQGALARRRGGAFSTTIANVWATLALRRFSERFESAAVAGTTTLSLGGDASSTPTRALAWEADGNIATQRFDWPDGRVEVRASHAGAGKPWAEIRSVAAVPLAAPRFAGYRVERSWQGVVQKTPGVWSRGDVVRVRLIVDAQSDFSWVVVEDPIPAGATILGSGLGRDSALLTEGERDDSGDWGCPCRAFTERTALAYRDYFEYVPKGRFAVEYTLRLNQDGEFNLPPTHVEAMYAPETFADLPHATLRVQP